MDRYAEHVKRMGDFRVRQSKPRLAIDEGLMALAIGGPQDRAVTQMIGVCYGMLREPAPMKYWITKSLEGTSGVTRGEALRDLGKALSGLGDYEGADAAFAESLELLPEESHPAARGATYGMMAKSHRERDNLPRALADIREAIRLCCLGDNNYYLLYRLLDGASIESQAGNQRRARALANQARLLALSPDPNHPEKASYGGPAHLLRAKALAVGGYRAESLLVRARPLIEKGSALTGRLRSRKHSG